MKFIGKELKYLMLWLLVGFLLVPPLFSWLVSRGLVALPGMESVAWPVTYLYFARHLLDPLPLAAVLCPYLMFIGARLLQDRTVTAPGQATGQGEPGTVQQLSEQGGACDGITSESPLHLAAMCGDLSMTWLLLEGGADFDAIDPEIGYSPLQVAALQGHADICEALIRYGAAVDARTSRQETALHLATRAGHAAVVTVLLKYRANTGLMNHAGQTAQQLAEQEGHAGVVELMEQHASSEWPYLRLSSG